MSRSRRRSLCRSPGVRPLNPTRRTLRSVRAAKPTTTERPRTACVFACGLVMVTKPGCRLPTAITVVSGFDLLPLPSSACEMSVTCEPGTTLPGTETVKSFVYAVTAARTVSDTVREMAPASSTLTNLMPRLSFARTLKAKRESGLAARSTVTLGAVRSSVLLSTVGSPSPQPAREVASTSGSQRSAFETSVGSERILIIDREE